VVRCLEIIGEAVRAIPKNVRQKYPKVEWNKISGLRDILIHRYFRLDLSILWNIVQNQIPELKEKIQGILKKESKNPG